MIALRGFIIKMTVFFTPSMFLLLLFLMDTYNNNSKNKFSTCFVFIYHRHSLHMTITLLNILMGVFALPVLQIILKRKNENQIKTIITCVYMSN